MNVVSKLAVLETRGVPVPAAVQLVFARLVYSLVSESWHGRPPIHLERPSRPCYSSATFHGLARQTRARPAAISSLGSGFGQSVEATANDIFMLESRSLLRTLFVLLPLSAGCNGGPFPEAAALNPYYRQQWRADEEAGPTYYTRLQEYQRLQRRAPQMSPEEQEQVAIHMAQLLGEETNGLLRREIVVTLGHVSAPSALTPLRAALSDANPDIRVTACRAWSRRGGPEAVAALAGAARDDQALDVRLAATQELGKFSGPQVIEALAVPLNDKDPALQFTAVESLRSTTGRNYGSDVAGWRAFVQGSSSQPPAGPSLADRVRDLF